MSASPWSWTWRPSAARPRSACPQYRERPRKSSTTSLALSSTADGKILYKKSLLVVCLDFDLFMISGCKVVTTQPTSRSGPPSWTSPTPRSSTRRRRLGTRRSWACWLKSTGSPRRPRLRPPLPVVTIPRTVVTIIVPVSASGIIFRTPMWLKHLRTKS